MNTKTNLFRYISICLVVSMLLVPIPGAQAAAGDTTLISVKTGGTQGNNDSYIGTISPDGRYVAFQSWASNLVDGYPNSATDIFLHDRVTGQTAIISVDSNETQAYPTLPSYVPSLSSDGGYIAFDSMDILASGDNNFDWDIYVRDRVNGTTNRVSVSTTGLDPNGMSQYPSISADGRYVAFYSEATNLISSDTNGMRDVFVRDRTAGTTTRVSVATGGTAANGICGNPNVPASPGISSDGRYVVFSCVATNLVADDTNGVEDVFLHDRTLAQTLRVSVATSGEANGKSFRPSISSDGRYITFESDASNLVPGDTNGEVDIFVYDHVDQVMTRVSKASDGTQANGTSSWSSISANGGSVVFMSTASNLVSGDTNATYDIFVHERTSGVTRRVSVASDGAQANGASGWGRPSISADGALVAFDSNASNLVGADTNGYYDVFVNEKGMPPQKTPLIFIPGIGGTRLVDDADPANELWPRLDYVPCNDNHDSLLLQLQLTADTFVDMFGPVLKGGVLRSETAKCLGVTVKQMDFYDTTVNTLVGAGYQLGDLSSIQPGDTLFLFAYDWRKSAADNGQLLLTAIDNVRSATGSSRVDLMAHSMGGLVARTALAEASSTGKVRKLLTLGTPVLGAVKALGLLEYRSPCFAEPDPMIGCPLDSDTLRQTVSNFPGVYQLLPGRMYDQTGAPAPLLINWGVNNDTHSDGPQDYDGWSAVLAADPALNGTALSASETFHATYDNHAFADPAVQYAAAVGNGIPTPLQIEEYRLYYFVTDTYSIEHRVVWDTAGDGTVPYASAALYDPGTGLDIRNGAAVKVYSLEHGALATDATLLQDAIAFFNSADNTFVSAAGTTSNVAAAASTGGTVIEITGSAGGYIADSLDNRSGNNSTYDGMVLLNVPGSYYYALGDTQSYFLRNDDTYQAHLNATGAGDAELRVANITDNQVQQQALFDVTLGAADTFSVGMTSGQDVEGLQVQVDRSGDGSIDETLAPDVVLYTISGHAGAPGVTLTYNYNGTRTVVSDNMGSYAINVPSGWSGTVTPAKTVYTFIPSERTYQPITEPIGSQNYVAKTRKSFKSVGSADGWILESSETSGRGGSKNSTTMTFNLGDDAADKQYRALLSFDTSKLPDTATISRVTLKIKNQGLVGTNPFTTHGGLKVDIRKLYFGPALGLAAGDFQASASKTGIATFNKTPAAGGWYAAVLNSMAFPYINRKGTTQLRLQFALDDNDDLGADYMKFFSGEAGASYRPVLIIEYYIP